MYGFNEYVLVPVLPVEYSFCPVYINALFGYSNINSNPYVLRLIGVYISLQLKEYACEGTGTQAVVRCLLPAGVASAAGVLYK